MFFCIFKLFHSNKKSLSLIDLLDSWAPLTKKNKTKKTNKNKKKMHSTNYTISSKGDAHIIISRGVFRTLPNI